MYVSGSRYATLIPCGNEMPSVECTFNQTISVGIYEIDGSSMRHDVDRGKRSSAACSLSSESTNVFRDLFLCIETAPHVEYFEPRASSMATVLAHRMVESSFLGRNFYKGVWRRNP